MIGDIIKKEILDNLLSHKFLFIFILCSVLILFSVYIGALDYVQSKKEYDSNVASLNERMQTTVSVFGERFGYRIYRPPQVLRAAVVGVEDAAGRATYPNNIYENNLAESRQESNTIFTLFGSLDLMFAVKFILSLCALFLTYDAVSGEKEKGTLKLTLSNNVSRARLISGKIIGNYVSLLLLFLAPLLMGLILLSVFPGISLTGGDWLRLLFIIIMFLLYISVFFALGIFISAVTTRSSISFLILLFIWVALVIVIPGAAVVAAEKIRPIPSSSMLVNQKGLFVVQTQQEVIQDMLSGKLSREPGFSLQQEMDDRIEANNVKENRDYQLKRDAQQNLSKNLSRISPAAALTFGSMTLARTGADEYDRFLAAARAYRPIYKKWNNDRSAAQPKPGGTGAAMITSLMQATPAKPDESIIATIPQLPYAPESLSESLARTLPDFALMAAMTIIFLTGAYFAFLRYDVR